jgi:hypothetical protein
MFCLSICLCYDSQEDVESDKEEAKLMIWTPDTVTANPASLSMKSFDSIVFDIGDQNTFSHVSSKK